MQTINKYFLLATVLFAMMIISGCGFQFRNPNDLPSQLHTIYLSSTRPNDMLIIQLQRTLEALNVHFVNSPDKAPVTLKISNISYQHNNPNVISTITAISYLVSLDATVTLLDSNNKPILPPYQLHVARNVILNTNQILIPNILRDAAHNLTREGVNLIYYWLTTANNRYALSQMEQHHANSTRSTRHQSKK